MKLHESGAALAEDMGMPVSKMWESIEAQIQASLNTAQDHDGGPYPVYPSGKSWDESLWQNGLREEVLQQSHFGSRLRSTALLCCNYHSSHPLLHGRLGN